MNHAINRQLELHQCRTLSKRADPVTSEIAVAKITRTGQRQSQCDKVYKALQDHDGATSAEIGEVLRKLDKSLEKEKFRQIAARRLPDPKNIHRIRQNRNIMRKCKQTGNLSVTWWVI